MKRILHCFSSLDNGGVEAFVMNVYRNIDRSKFQFDFLLRSDKRTHYWDEIENLGGKIFVTPSYPKHFISNYIVTKKFFEQHNEYDTIHIHANSLMYMYTVKLAKKFSIKNIIIHSHNTNPKNNKLTYLHNINKKHIEEYANTYLACSELAGKWMFNGDFRVINNGIDYKKFQFDSVMRDKIRDELGIQDEFLIGNIGRFTPQKNHIFIIKTFSEYKKVNNNSKLLLVGFGELENDIRNQVKELGLENDVIILTGRNDAHNLLQAIDLFFFPSNFEGLGISLIEAQASGLPCVISDNIPSEAILDNRVKVLSLNEDVSKWIEEIDKVRFSNYCREDGVNIIKSNKYDISDTCDQLLKIYNR